MTHNNHENLSMMDAVTTKYGKTTFVTVTKTLAIILVVVFFICLVATGLLVYSFTSCPKNDTTFLTDPIEDSVSAKQVTSLCDTIQTMQAQNTTRILQTTTVTEPTTTTTPKTVVKNLDIRLPKNIVPDLYEIHLTPFIHESNFTFHGEETILINVTEASSNVTLHSMSLIIEAVNIRNLKNESISIKNEGTMERQQFIIFDLDGILEAGHQYYIYIKFKGVLNDMLQGFYRSSYVENNVTRWIAATQFQSTDARKAFPCFDEPAFKARFQINIARPKNMTAISNMPRKSTTQYVNDLPDYVWDHFEESLPMSTYLVAFVVSDFKNISNGIFSVWARASALSQAKFALDIGPGILKHYEKFFGSKYPLPKVDMVAISDFSAGAMENWGLITYREPALLYEKGVSSGVSKQRIAHVVAHELAHQWFGNLVTPVWWEDVWLNEGFATYVEFLGAHAVNPKWKDLDLFLVSELHESLSLDALKSSHPISVKVNDPEEVNDIFDKISYSKGASIIRMMREFLGDEIFHSGLHKYLKNRMFKNAEQDDLWQTLTDQASRTEVLPKNTTVKEIMDTWTLQTGFPVVTAKQSQIKDHLVISQERYVLNSNEVEDQTLWWIPISVFDSTSKKTQTWLKKEKQIVLSNSISSQSSWYLLNFHQTGYYRVNYNVDNWKALIKQLLESHHAINSKNRAQMIDDAMNLAYAGYLDYGIAFNVTRYLRNERQFGPWKTALNNFQFLYNMFIRTGHFDKFKVYLISLLKDFYKELTFKESSNDDPTQVLNRMEIVDYACKLGLKHCVLQAVQFFQNWRNSANPDKENLINPDLRQTVYCTAIGDGGQEEWEFAWSRYVNTNVASDKEILLNSLACSKDIWILSRYLEWSITENSGIRKQDTARVFASVSENPIGYDLAYRFLKTHWKSILDYLGHTSLSLSSLVSSSTQKFNTEEEVNDFKAFVEKNKDKLGTAFRTAQQSIEQGVANTRWMARHFNVVKKWLEITTTE
ncbi:aminopeptidase Ey [Euwallacea similis]|uniref:aminopeptidase Ey n=1 Tax=Euwallacea similis TaxID=1736056 RepID=UPI00344E900B